jgi:hypothetical protein
LDSYTRHARLLLAPTMCRHRVSGWLGFEVRRCRSNGLARGTARCSTESSRGGCLYPQRETSRSNRPTTRSRPRAHRTRRRQRPSCGRTD